MSDVRVGMFAPIGQFAAPAPQRAAMLGGRNPDGFEHVINVWCGFGETREGARTPLAEAMSRFYQMPFEPFERYSLYGRPEDVAESCTRTSRRAVRCST